MRYPMLVIIACVLTGCASDVALRNPRTGEVAICRESLWGLNPWSQKEACVGDHVAGGWTRAGRD